MKKFRDFLNEELKDKKLAKEYYKELENARVALEITFFREKLGIKQKELAKMLNTTQSVVARLENPEYKKYSLSTLRKVAEALNLELSISFKEKGKEKGVEKYEKKYTAHVVYKPYATPAEWEKSMYKFSSNLMQEKIQEKSVA